MWKLGSCVAGVLLLASSATGAEPLKVYILAGQSNMQGHAHVRTFGSLADDPATVDLLAEMQTPDGAPVVCEDVWISSIVGSSIDEEQHGQLTAGYGASANGPKIGPEFTFGIRMQKLVGEPILIIKTAWGGKSIHTDFRPPSAGPYVFSDQQLDSLRKRGTDLDQARREKAEATGHFYRLMLAHARHVLGDIGRVYPDYDPAAGYELAGFVWFQGWNDMVDGGVYPNRDREGGYDDYSKVLGHFIRDVRHDLDAPNLPFVIGVMGVGGPTEEYGPEQQRYRAVHSEFRKAMAAPASFPEFEGNVAAVLTEKYWDSELDELVSRRDKIRAKGRELQKNADLDRAERDALLEAFKQELYTPGEVRAMEQGTSNAAYHYLGAAKILARIGEAFAEAVHELDSNR